MPTISRSHICELCRRSYVGSGSLCPQCKPKRTREPAFKRGYDHSWRKIREQVLTDCGIPRESWSLYDIDHNPPYNPSIEPDHTKYALIPRLHADHSRKTAMQDTPRDSTGSFRGKK